MATLQGVAKDNLGQVINVDNPTQSLTDQGYVPIATPITPSITPESLKTETPVNIPATPTITTPDITKIDTNVDLFKPTNSENTLNDFSQKMIDLNNELVGKADYTNQLNEQYKTADITASLQDLNDQLTGLKNQQADLTNKYNYTIPNTMQVNATGRGITAGGLAPLTASELRKNQIEQGGLASKALTLSSLMSAYQGKLATAQNFIDQAIKAKYDPIEAKLTALTKNAEIIKNSPQYSLEDKKRAQDIIDQNNAKAEEIQNNKEDMAAILATATTAAQAGVKSDVLDAIHNAKTPMEALQLAAKAGVYTSQEDKTMAMNGYTKLKPSQLRGLKEEQLLRMPNGDVYKKPSTDLETIKSIQTKYPDAGIKATDTIEQATAKLQKSQIYQKEVNTGKTSFGKIGTDSNGNDIFGFIDTEKKTTTPTSSNGFEGNSTTSIGDVTVTGANGSDLWKPGLDMVVAGGKGAEIKTPDSGTVIFAGKNGGFGNQVKIRTADGREVWLSHLESINVNVGDNINTGSVIGTQGNSGNTYSNSGGDGTHLDLTMKKPDGTFYSAQDVAKMINVQKKVSLSKGAQAVVNNPALYQDMTATEKGKVLKELDSAGYDTTALGAKGLSDTAIQTINQTDSAITALNDLRTTVQNNLEYMGPISGFAALNPWSKARQAQADVDRVRQIVGKALEGGVLRKEDEDKYKKILATLNDTPENATYKIDQIMSSLKKTLEDYKNLQELGGRSLDVNGTLPKKGTPITINNGSGSDNRPSLSSFEK